MYSSTEHPNHPFVLAVTYNSEGMVEAVVNRVIYGYPGLKALPIKQTKDTQREKVPTE